MDNTVSNKSRANKNVQKIKPSEMLFCKSFNGKNRSPILL